MLADEELHRHAAWNLDQADALLFGGVRVPKPLASASRPAAPSVVRSSLLGVFASLSGG